MVPRVPRRPLCMSAIATNIHIDGQSLNYRLVQDYGQQIRDL